MNVISFTELKDKFNLGKPTFAQKQGLISAIPLKWKLVTFAMISGPRTATQVIRT